MLTEVQVPPVVAQVRNMQKERQAGGRFLWLEQGQGGVEPTEWSRRKILEDMGQERVAVAVSFPSGEVLVHMVTGEEAVTRFIDGENGALCQVLKEVGVTNLRMARVVDIAGAYGLTYDPNNIQSVLQVGDAARQDALSQTQNEALGDFRSDGNIRWAFVNGCEEGGSPAGVRPQYSRQEKEDNLATAQVVGTALVVGVILIVSAAKFFGKQNSDSE